MKFTTLKGLHRLAELLSEDNPSIQHAPVKKEEYEKEEWQRPENCRFRGGEGLIPISVNQHQRPHGHGSGPVTACRPTSIHDQRAQNDGKDPDQGRMPKHLPALGLIAIQENSGQTLN